MKNNRALATIPLVALFSLAAVGYFMYNLATAQDPHVEYVGETAERILKSIERQERGFEFYDQMVRYAANDAINRQIRNHGFTTQDYIDNNCEQLIHPIVNDTCQWNVADNASVLIDKELQKRKSKNPYTQARLTTFERPKVDRIGDRMSIIVKTEETVKTGLRDSVSETITGKGQTVFGEETVSLATFENIDCNNDNSCTGLPKQCEVTPNVFKRLSRLDNLLVREGIQATITQSTRTWEMQQALYQRAQYCQRWKQRECSNPDSDQCGKKYDTTVGECFSETCKACDPGKPNQPRRCPHMTGQAVDIVIPGMWQNREAMKSLMCHFDMKHTVGGELWHYEAKSCNPTLSIEESLNRLNP